MEIKSVAIIDHSDYLNFVGWNWDRLCRDAGIGQQGLTKTMNTMWVTLLPSSVPKEYTSDDRPLLCLKKSNKKRAYHARQ
jgi:hypothetical protein